MDIASLLIPLLLTAAALWALRKRIDVYDALTAGASEGLLVLVRIAPSLIALLTAVYMLRASGALTLLTRLLTPVLERLGIPPETAALLLVRPEFMRIHRSYIVNMLQIDELSPAGVHTFSGANLPVSRLLYPQLQKDYMKLLFAQREE